MPRSVHLAVWDVYAPPGTAGDDPLRKTDDTLRTWMGTTRAAVRVVLEARSAAGIAVRQPLVGVALSTKYHDAYSDIIADETNVKKVDIDASLGGDDIHLDTVLTPELKREGMIRELVRAVNNMRKEMGLAPSDRIAVTYHTDDAELTVAMDEHRAQLERSTAASAWVPGTPTASTELSLGDATITLRIAR